MDFKFSRAFNTSILILIILTILCIHPLMNFSLKLFDIEYEYTNTLFVHAQLSLYSFLYFLDNIVIGLWFSFNASKFKHDQNSWTVIGLVYGKYALVMLLFSFFLQAIKSRVNLKVQIRQFLFICLLALGISYLVGFIAPILTNRYMGPIGSMNFDIYGKLNFLLLFPMLIFQIGVIIRFYKILNEFAESRKFIWLVSTLFFGLLTVILYYQLLIITNDEELSEYHECLDQLDS